MSGIKLVICLLVLVACGLSIRLGFELALINDSFKSEIIKKYKSGEIACAEVGNELVCRGAK